MRKHQNSTGTFGTVDHAARSICVGCRLRGIVQVAQQQQPVAEIRLVRLELRLGIGIGRVCAQRLERRVRLDAADDAHPRALDQLVDAGDRLVDRARGDQAQQPGHFDFGVRRAPCDVRPTEDRERRRGRRGLPFRLDRGDFHLLVLARHVAGLIAQHHHRQRAGQPKACRDRHRALGDLDVAAAQQVPGADRQHEHRADDVAGRRRYARTSPAPPD